MLLSAGCVSVHEGVVCIYVCVCIGVHHIALLLLPNELRSTLLSVAEHTRVERNI